MSRTEIRRFRQSLQTHLVTQRFNTETYEATRTFCRRRIPNGCAYGSPTLLCRAIPLNSPVMVIEMNNETNRIMGIGLVSNSPHKYRYRIYEDTIEKHEQYNRYAYLGKYRIDRSELTEYEERVIRAMEILCFYGKDHVKRGQGLLTFPLRKLWYARQVIDLVQFMQNMFRTRINPSENNSVGQKIKTQSDQIKTLEK